MEVRLYCGLNGQGKPLLEVVCDLQSMTSAAGKGSNKGIRLGLIMEYLQMQVNCLVYLIFS